MPTAAVKRRFRLTTTLDVLEELGINLYTNSAAVLSEIVANAWDADAKHVNVYVAGKGVQRSLAIQDDGIGMSLRDINERFLMVGHHRRNEPAGSITKLGRHVLGRKGIGKLSSFSIASIVEVHSVKGRSRLAFQMNVDEIRKAALSKSSYFPKEITCAKDLKEGTRLILRALKPNVVVADGYLRRKLSRRFSLIAPGNDFQVSVNGKPLTLEDREYYGKFQYIWYFGEDDLSSIATSATHRENREDLVATLKVAGKMERCTINGWIASVSSRAQLTSRDEESLNAIALTVRGKVAHENLLRDINDAGIFASYLIGEIEANFLDIDRGNDIAASNRQGIIESDPRFVALRHFLQNEITYIGGCWTKLRNSEATEKALQIPAVNDWYNRLSTRDQKIASSILGKLNQIDVKTDNDRRTLFAQGVLTFEMFRVKQNVDALDHMDAHDITTLATVFQNVSAVEAALYYEVVKQRLGVIRKLEAIVDQNDLEFILRDHIFDQLWLLDPSWARATEVPVMETVIRKVVDKIDAKLPKSIAESRVDIKYREASGRHVIIELKRAGRALDTMQILNQVSKYDEGIASALDSVGRSKELHEIVVLVGRPLSDWTTDANRQKSRELLAIRNTRVIQYAEIIAEAKSNYHDYLKREEKASSIAQLVNSISLADMTDFDSLAVPGRKSGAGRRPRRNKKKITK